jgi:rubrerythrin
MAMSQIAKENDLTVQSLITALDSELNAYTKYMAYAARADFDGLHETASLLRAIARSEQIHANNHARLIRRLGGEPETQIRPAEVNATLDNLAAALGDELYEVESMYPRFLTENGLSDNSAARTYTWALKAEKTHAQLLSEAIKAMKAGNADSSACVARDFYVRPVCGSVSTTPEPERCWACNQFCSTFEIIR